MKNTLTRRVSITEADRERPLLEVPLWSDPENYLRVALIRSGDTVIIMNKVCDAQMNMGGTTTSNRPRYVDTCLVFLLQRPGEARRKGEKI